MADAIVRFYESTDDATLERGNLFHALLGTHLAQFTPLFPFIDAPWRTAFKADIDAADAFPKDDQVVGQIKINTGDVGEAMGRGRSAFGTLGVYAKLTWPEDKNRQRQFGQDLWVERRNSQTGIIEGLQLAYNVANMAANKVELIAKGFLQVSIDNLQALALEIQNKNDLQELSKSLRGPSTGDRVMLHNIFFGKMQILNAASEVVFADDAARQELYNLYPVGSGTASTVVIVTVNVAGGAPAVGASVQSNAPLVAQTTGADGKVTFESVDMPELITFSITPSGGGAAVIFPDQYPVVLGQVNNITLTMP